MNKRVPFAILSCFTIAFILQGVLKLSGVFIFEKALNWEIFKIIDNSTVLSIIYYSLFVLLAMYCLSFTFSKHCYSKRWYHYIILVVGAFGTTTMKFLLGTAHTVQASLIIDILYDLFTYVAIPLLIYFTTPREDRLFEKYTVSNVVLIITLQLLLYLFYLGLNYWSALLSSIIPSLQHILYASTAVLTQIEVYIGLVTLMLTINVLIQNFMKEDTMLKPINVASEKAKDAELKRVKAEKAAKKRGK